jgi:hypothetical protein
MLSWPTIRGTTTRTKETEVVEHEWDEEAFDEDDDEDEDVDHEDRHPVLPDDRRPAGKAWIGRYRGVGSRMSEDAYWYRAEIEEYGSPFSGPLEFLDGAKLPRAARRGAEDPTEQQLSVAFGEHAELAAEMYWCGWDEPGFADVLISTCEDELGIERVPTILGDRAAGSSVIYDCFSADPAAALAGLRERLSVIEGRGLGAPRSRRRLIARRFATTDGCGGLTAGLRARADSSPPGCSACSGPNASPPRPKLRPLTAVISARDDRDQTSELPDFATAVEIERLIAADGDLVPDRWLRSPLLTEDAKHAAQAAMADAERAGAPLADVRAAKLALSRGQDPEPKRRRIRELVAEGRIEILPGTRVRLNTAGDGMGVLGPWDFNDRAPRDAPNTTELPRTNPGDVIVLPSSGKFSALVDREGGNLLASPLQAMRIGPISTTCARTARSDPARGVHLPTQRGEPHRRIRRLIQRARHRHPAARRRGYQRARHDARGAGGRRAARARTRTNRQALRTALLVATTAGWSAALVRGHPLAEPEQRA